MIAGMVLATLVIMLVLHKAWYGTYKIDFNNFPHFTRKVKKKLGMKKEEYLKLEVDKK